MPIKSFAEQKRRDHVLFNTTGLEGTLNITRAKHGKNDNKNNKM